MYNLDLIPQHQTQKDSNLTKESMTPLTISEKLSVVNRRDSQPFSDAT